MNSDLRLIDIDTESGLVTITADKLWDSMTEVEHAVQRVTLALLNTPGSMIDAVEWGGGAKNLILVTRAKNIEESSLRVADVVLATEESVLASENDVVGDYQIVGLEFLGVERLETRLAAKIRINFLSAEPQNFMV